MHPGSQLSDRRIQYDSQTAALVGRRVLEVRYWDVHNFGDEPRTWDYDDWHHAVLGVELLTDHGPACVLWTSSFFSYGVEVFPAPMSEHVVTGDEGSESWDVSASERWRERIGSPVLNVQTCWERITVGPGYVRGVRTSDPYGIDVPVALRIDVDAGPVWMVAAIPRSPEMREFVVLGDEIVVVFAVERMRQIGFPDSGFLAARGGCWR